VTDGDIRLHILETFVESGAPPTVAETAAALDVTVEDAEAAYRRLEEARSIVLAPGTSNVWMANPLSAVPTPFPVETPRGSYFGNCVWDALGVVAMLGREGRVRTWCPDCGDPIQLVVRDGELADADGVAHYAVPAREWWTNIGYT
jgi:hypothetical protein